MGEGKILPFWGSKRLTDFSHSGFDTFKAGLLEHKLAPRTVNIVLMRLREMLRMAYQRGYLTEDRASWVVKVRDSRSEIFPLSFEEKSRFINALPVRWKPYFLVAFGTGLRPSEQIALRQEAIDWGRNKILVREGWRHGQPTRLKTRASLREVDILPPVRRALAEQRKIAGAHELVFPNIRGTGFDEHDLASRLLNEAGVAVLPGTALGPAGKGFIRLAYTQSEDELKLGLRRIKEFIAANKS